MMLRPLVLALLALSCGRDQTLLLGGDDEDGGLRKDGFVTPTDGPILLDDSPLLDLGVDSGSECNRPRDCRMKYGDPPPCPNGGPSFWECTGEGVCQSNCMPGECVNDCDCPFELACLGGICQPAGRTNLCCT